MSRSADSSPQRGDTIRLKEPNGVPPQYHGQEVEVAEVIVGGAVRIKDKAEWGGPTERDPDELVSDNPHCPYTVTSKDYEVVADDD